MSKKTIKEIIFAGGKNRRAYFVNKGAEVATIIDAYFGVLVSYDEGRMNRMMFTQEDDISIFVVSRKRKVSTVLICDNPEEKSDDDLLSSCHEFEGVLVLFFHCENEENGYRMIFVDSRDKMYRSICFECFGFPKEFIFEASKAWLSSARLEFPLEAVQFNDANHLLHMKEEHEE